MNTQKSVIGTVIAKERVKKGLSQAELAEVLGVSRQTVQKWESGANFPETEKLTYIAAYFNVSLDYLLRGKDERTVEQLRVDAASAPSYDAWHYWEAYYKNLAMEYRQAEEEGKNIERYRDLFFAADRIPDGKDKDTLGDVLYHIAVNAPTRAGYPYTEPDGWDEIAVLRDGYVPAPPEKSKIPFSDRMLGAWYGRICGCLLGKPVEGMKRYELLPYLKDCGNFPMHRYLAESDAEKSRHAHGFPLEKRLYTDGIMDGMPPDDDTNYIVLALLAIKTYGEDFTSENMADIWLQYQGKNAFCTAERVAYRNFINGYLPHESATYKNPFREWIGAQIRGDFFGWIHPGDPEKAAENAWTDARMSHVKNGIYGEMWVSAMLAAAGAGYTVKESVKVGLSYIPKTSRLYAAVTNVIKAYENGTSAEEFFRDFHTRWNDEDNHHWCHTVSNAEIVAAVLLWGGNDYGKTVCMAVEQGFDTDCNAATAGSVLGMTLGAGAIPPIWKEKINHTLKTDIFGYERVTVEEMAKISLEFTKMK